MVWALAYIATIFGANLLITHVGVVPVGVWPTGQVLLAPAGVYCAGLAFTFRDLTQDTLGRAWTIGAIVVGAALSALLSPQLALASGTAFLLSELADLAVYTPLRERHWLAAVAVSNTVGLLVDSVLFLLLAFGSLDFLPGQIVGKWWMTALAVAVLWLWRRTATRPRQA